MQKRPYPEKDGLQIWLSRSEQQELLDAVEDEPHRRIALQLGLHGLRTDEVVRIEPQHLRALRDGEDHVLITPDGKSGKGETPVSADLAERIRYLKSAAHLRQNASILDVSPPTVRNWLQDAREVLLEDEPEVTALGMHDLRRTWGD